jgi:hypothetical protein
MYPAHELARRMTLVPMGAIATLVQELEQEFSLYQSGSGAAGEGRLVAALAGMQIFYNGNPGSAPDCLSTLLARAQDSLLWPGIQLCILQEAMHAGSSIAHRESLVSTDVTMSREPEIGA